MQASTYHEVFDGVVPEVLPLETRATEAETPHGNALLRLLLLCAHFATKMLSTNIIMMDVSAKTLEISL